MKTLKFIDLFAGMGGFRLGFEQAAQEKGISVQCIFSSEIKPHAIDVYKANFCNTHTDIKGDITKIASSEIPDFDILLGGFPCQTFSNAGKRQGFLDTRGTLFFEIERILKDKKPKGFILENVDGLVKHNLQNKTDEIGQTLSVILTSLNNLGYSVNWKVLDASKFGLAQARKRIFIVGNLKSTVDLSNFDEKYSTIGDILENGKPTLTGDFIEKLLSKFPLEQLYGKSIKDKRGGKNNIHSWDIELKGSVSKEQIELLNKIMRARRNKKWADLKGIKWMDGMPLTLSEISTFYQHKNLKKLLDDLCLKKYLRLEHPKDVVNYIGDDGKNRTKREYRTDLEKGYNIVAGKLSYEINKILDPKDIAPALVATDLNRIAIPDNKGLRMLTPTEQKRLFGFPDNFSMEINQKHIFDLFGNTVAIPVVKAVSLRLLDTI